MGMSSRGNMQTQRHIRSAQAHTDTTWVYTQRYDGNESWQDAAMMHRHSVQHNTQNDGNVMGNACSTSTQTAVAINNCTQHTEHIKIYMPHADIVLHILSFLVMKGSNEGGGGSAHWAGKNREKHVSDVWWCRQRTQNANTPKQSSIEIKKEVTSFTLCLLFHNLLCGARCRASCLPYTTQRAILFYDTFSNCLASGVCNGACT